MKRTIALLLCVAMLFAAAPAVFAEETAPDVPATSTPTEPAAPAEPAEPNAPAEPDTPEEPAEPDTPEEPEEPQRPKRPARPTRRSKPGISASELKMEQLAWDTFTDCLRRTGAVSFHGMCGKFVSHQLYSLGINRSLSSRDGKDHYNYYSKLEKTTGGYFPRAIPAEEVHLTGALNYITGNGSKDVYNVMVGFNWTHTEAGQKYGHVVLIYAIIGGKVYFSESYDMSLNGKSYREGSLIKCSIEDFVGYYDGWTEYEGIVVFGTKDYTEFCEQENTNLMVQTRFDTVLRSQPCQIGKNKSTLLRNVAAGERLQATAVFTNGDQEKFYRIADGDMIGYVSANAVYVLQANPFNSYVEELNFPKVLTPGEDVEISGVVAGEYARVRGVTVQLVDGENQILQEQLWENYSNQCKLTPFNDKLDFAKLSLGLYTLKILGDVRCATADGGLLDGRALLGGTYFQVGGEQFISRALPALRYQDMAETSGWRYDGGWYFYEGEVPKTGWFTWCGVQYYFDETGQAVTGWVTLDEKLHYFSATGALVKNTRIAQEKTIYQIDEQGVATKVKK